MDFTSVGDVGGQLGFGISQAPDLRGAFAGKPSQGAGILSAFAQLPMEAGSPDRDSPVLVIPPPMPPRRRGVWGQRIWLIVFVLFCLEVGIVLTWCPWTKLWTENSLLAAYPSICGILTQSFVRGAISGLGLVNIWMGIAEAIHYREN